jgi:glyoxylase-like metal-dependent hydrolase (beta-lactamase superfamily II)
MSYTSRREAPVKTLLAFAVLLQAAASAPSPNPADFPQIKKLADNAYVWSDVHPSGLYTTNDLIVITTDGVLVADGQKDAETTKKMIDRIATLTRQPIKVVVIASEHGDHTGGNAAFTSGGSAVTFIKSPLATGKRQTLNMGGTEIQVLDNGRAHTGTDLEVYLPKEKILFVSEVFSNHIFPNMRAAVPSEWIQTVKNVGRIDASTVIPGHGYIEDGAKMKASLADFEKSLEFIVAEATRLHKAGLSVEAATKQANWGPYAAWTATDRNASVAIQRVYDELDGKLK